MAIIYRAVKGRELTNAEVDANFSQLANGSIAGFKQSGTDVERSWIDKAREVFSRDDFVSKAEHDTEAASRFSVTVPTDYATLQGAVDTLSSRVVGNGVDITINIASGHALTSGLLVKNGDYGNIRITSTDATVPVTSGVTGDLLAAVNARMPIIACKIDMANATGTGDGYSLQHGSIGYIPQDAGHGVINARGRGVYVNEGSSLSARGSNFSGARGAGAWVTRASQANLENANLSSCGAAADDNLGRQGGNIRHGAIGNLYNANLSGAEQDGLVVSRGFCEARLADITDAGRYGIDARSGSIVTAEEADVSGAGTLCIRVLEGSIVDANGVVTDTGTPGNADLSVVPNTHSRAGIIHNPAANVDNTTQVVRARTYDSMTIADDAATSIDMRLAATDWGILLIAASSSGNGFPNGAIRYRVGVSPEINDISLMTTTNVTLTTVALTGTTGADGDFTIATHTDGKIYFENRTGASKSIRVFASG